MKREDFPARHPGCKKGNAPLVIPIYFHWDGKGGLRAHYVCPACGGWTNRWCAAVEAAGWPVSRSEAA